MAGAGSPNNIYLSNSIIPLSSSGLGGSTPINIAGSISDAENHILSSNDNYTVGKYVTYLGKISKLFNKPAKIVWTFQDNPHRFGIQFNHSVEDGWNLGGRCPDATGIMVSRDEIRPHDHDFLVLFVSSFSLPIVHYHHLIMMILFTLY